MIWVDYYLNWPLRRSSINDPILPQGDSEIVPKHGVVVGGKCQESGYLTSQAFNLTLRVSFLFSPEPILKGNCHGDFAIFSSKWLKYLTKNLFSNKKFLLEHREGNIKGFIRGRTNYKQFLTTSLQYTGGT